MKRFAIAASLIALISGIIFKGTWGHWIIVLATGYYLGAPLAFFMGIWFFIELKRTGGIPRGLRNTFLVSCIIGGSLLLSLGTGTAVHDWEIREARDYVAKIVPLLDEYQKEHGQYPKALADLNTSSPPKLLRDINGYSTTADSFRFEYWDSAEMLNGYSFDSLTREWTCFD